MGKKAKTVLSRAVKTAPPGALAQDHVSILLHKRQVVDQSLGCSLW